MEVLLAVLVGLLFAVGVYLMLRRNLLRVLFGLIVFSNAVNLLIFTLGRLTRAVPGVIPEGLEAPVGAVANPLPQALVLTAIVIGFGLVVFALVLVMRAYEALGTMVPDEIEGAARSRPAYGTDYLPSPPDSEEVSA